ncbi:universal stress protein [Streptomyces sp. NPDC057781]|uniref:universal stress protein n=1 Tax=unclassified Streptomyces TaxID=2593676 RepID=UPI003679D20F
MSGLVVVGVDGSPPSLAAVDVAVREARLRSAGLHVVHGFTWPALHPPVGPSPLGPAQSALREQVEHVVLEAVQRARAKAPDVEVTHAVIVGEALAVLEGQSRGAALLVVGNRGRGRFAGVLVGSVAVHLAGHAHCPVMVVRGRPDPAGPVLAGVDGSPESRAALAFACTEAALRDTGLVAVHVWGTRGDRTEVMLGLQAEEDHAARLRAEAEQMFTEALASLSVSQTGVKVSRRLVRGPVRQSLITESEGAQLLVLGARGHGGFAGLLLGSVSQAVLHHAHCPVGVVPGTDEER